MFFLYIILILCAVFVYIINRKKLPNSLLYLAILLLITAPKEIFTHLLYSKGKDRYIFNHLFQTLEFVLVSLTYYRVYVIPVNKRVVSICMWLYLPLSFYLLIYYEMPIAGKNNINYNLLIKGFVFIIYSLLYLYELFKHPVDEQLLKVPFFWINTGIFFYYAGSFFQLPLYNYVYSRSSHLADQLNLINRLLNYFLYVSFIIGFSCKTKQVSQL